MSSSQDHRTLRTRRDRMYTSTFGDWFSQAVIDFMLGTRTISVFSEFLLRLQSTDPRDLIRISRIRAEAIAECVSRVLPEGERLLSGWTLFSPTDMNVKIAEKIEEKVLLVVSRYIYERKVALIYCSRVSELYILSCVCCLIASRVAFNEKLRAMIIPSRKSRCIPVYRSAIS